MKGKTSRAKLGFREEVEGEEGADRRVDERLSSSVVVVLLFVWFCGECFWTTAWELNCKPAQPVRGIVAIRSTLLPNESTKLEIGNLLTFHSENTANKEKKREERKGKEKNDSGQQTDIKETYCYCYCLYCLLLLLLLRIYRSLF